MPGSASWPGSVSCGSPHTGARAAFGKPGYAEVPRGLGIFGTGEVLVAEDNRRIIGTVMLEPFHRFSEIARSPGEAEVRALAVAPQEQHRGTGRELVAAVIERATLRGLHRLLLSANPAMTAAQHLYRRAGFTRLPERDWSPAPGLSLLAFGLVLPQGGASTDRHRPQRRSTSYIPMGDSSAP